MKKTQIFMEFFYVSFKKDYLYLERTILFWKNTKIFMETLIYHQKATEQLGYRKKDYFFVLKVFIYQCDVESYKECNKGHFVSPSMKNVIICILATQDIYQYKDNH